MSWLAVDGYGFDRAYFDTRRWVDAQYVPAAVSVAGPPRLLPARGRPGHRAGAVVHPRRQARGRRGGRVARFARGRQADLWSGVGLAATFAGGCDAEGFATLREAVGPVRTRGTCAGGGVRRQGTRLRRSRARSTRSDAAVQRSPDLSIEDVVALADSTGVDLPRADDEPPYELWRQRITRRRVHAPAAS